MPIGIKNVYYKHEAENITFYIDANKNLTDSEREETIAMQRKPEFGT